MMQKSPNAIGIALILILTSLIPMAISRWEGEELAWPDVIVACVALGVTVPMFIVGYYYFGMHGGYWMATGAQILLTYFMCLRNMRRLGKFAPSLPGVFIFVLLPLLFWGLSILMNVAA